MPDASITKTATHVNANLDSKEMDSHASMWFHVRLVSNPLRMLKCALISMSAPLVVTATQKQFAETLKAHINANVKMVMKVMEKEFARKFQTKNHAKKKPIHATKKKKISQTLILHQSTPTNKTLSISIPKLKMKLI